MNEGKKSVILLLTAFLPMLIVLVFVALLVSTEKISNGFWWLSCVYALVLIILSVTKEYSINKIKSIFENMSDIERKKTENANKRNKAIAKPQEWLIILLSAGNILWIIINIPLIVETIKEIL